MVYFYGSVCLEIAFFMVQHLRVHSVTIQVEPILDRVYVYIYKKYIMCMCVCACVCVYLKQPSVFKSGNIT